MGAPHARPRWTPVTIRMTGCGVGHGDTVPHALGGSGAGTGEVHTAFAGQRAGGSPGDEHGPLGVHAGLGLVAGPPGVGPLGLVVGAPGVDAAGGAGATEPAPLEPDPLAVALLVTPLGAPMALATPPSIIAIGPGPP